MLQLYAASSHLLASFLPFLSVSYSAFIFCFSFLFPSPFSRLSVNFVDTACEGGDSYGDAGSNTYCFCDSDERPTIACESGGTGDYNGKASCEAGVNAVCSRTLCAITGLISPPQPLECNASNPPCASLSTVLHPAVSHLASTPHSCMLLTVQARPLPSNCNR